MLDVHAGDVPEADKARVRQNLALIAQFKL
jgi:hypothetical protein